MKIHLLIAAVALSLASAERLCAQSSPDLSFVCAGSGGYFGSGQKDPTNISDIGARLSFASRTLTISMLGPEPLSIIGVGPVTVTAQQILADGIHMDKTIASLDRISGRLDVETFIDDKPNSDWALACVRASPLF